MNKLVFVFSMSILSTSTLLNAATVFPPPIFTATIGVAKTGQSLCYNASGSIPCTGTGQDGDIQAGVAWPNPRFTENATGTPPFVVLDRTVTDNMTGLIWSKDANPANTEFYNWDAALDQIKILNSKNYLGYHDWRMPNRNELASLLDTSQVGPFLPHGHPFVNVMALAWREGSVFGSPTRADYYWSSTSVAGYENSAHQISFADGNISRDWKGRTSELRTLFLWPVRGGRSGQAGSLIIYKTGQTTCYDSDGKIIVCAGSGQDGAIQAGAPLPSRRFYLNGTPPFMLDGTITDTATGLIWSRNANPASASKTWQEALDYIKTLNSSNYLGAHDWRLPNINELNSLVDITQSKLALPVKNPFTNVNSKYYWSSSPSRLLFPDSKTLSGAWVMYYGNHGEVSNRGTSDVSYVWPVRGGPIK